MRRRHEDVEGLAARALLTTPLAVFLCESTWTACTLANVACAQRLRSRWGLRMVATTLPASPMASSRRRLWHRLCLGSIDFGGDSAGVGGYRDLSKQPNARSDAEIRRDINRTFPEALEPRDTQALFHILRAVSNKLDDVGYCQGMNFLAGVFVRVFGSALENDEAICYQCMLSVFLRYGMNQFFGDRFPKLRLAALQFDCLVEVFLPDLSDAFEAFNLSAEFYATQWFLSLFSYSLPFPYVMRIWDQFLCRGMKLIHRVGLALLKAARPMLLGQGFDETIRRLRHVGDYVTLTPEALIEEAMRFKVTNRLLCGLEQAMRSSGPLHGLPQCFPERDLTTGRTQWHVFSPEHTSSASTMASAQAQDGDGMQFLEDALPAPRIPMDPLQPYSPLDMAVGPADCYGPALAGSAEGSKQPRSHRRARGRVKAFRAAVARSVKKQSHRGGFERVSSDVFEPRASSPDSCNAAVLSPAQALPDSGAPSGAGIGESPAAGSPCPAAGGGASWGGAIASLRAGVAGPSRSKSRSRRTKGGDDGAHVAAATGDDAAATVASVATSDVAATFAANLGGADAAGDAGVGREVDDERGHDHAAVSHPDDATDGQLGPSPSRQSADPVGCAGEAGPAPGLQADEAAHGKASRKHGKGWVGHLHLRPFRSRRTRNVVCSED